MKDADDIQALRRGIVALKLLNHRDSVSSVDLAQALSVSRTAAQRVLNSLLAMGYVCRLPSRPAGRYRLAARVRSLSSGFAGDRRLVHVARPLMIRFTEQSGWPLALVVPAGDRTYVCLNTDDAAPRALKRYRAGFYGELLASASGMLCLAHMAEPVRTTVIAALRRKQGSQYELARDNRRLVNLMSLVRSQNFADYLDPGDRERNLAVPVRTEGALIGCLVMRFMNVAAKGGKGHLQRITQLRELAASIEQGLVELSAASQA
jgi:DNA-binding IclR family transcriptional regulator